MCPSGHILLPLSQPPPMDFLSPPLFTYVNLLGMKQRIQHFEYILSGGHLHHWDTDMPVPMVIKQLTKIQIYKSRIYLFQHHWWLVPGHSGNPVHHDVGPLEAIGGLEHHDGHTVDLDLHTTQALEEVEVGCKTL